MLPFEVPPTFTNRGFYRFLRINKVEIEDGCVCWRSNSDDLDTTMALLFGFDRTIVPDIKTFKEWGGTYTRRAVKLRFCKLDTIPFNFRVAHNLDGRTLSVVHPRNQIQIANFYASCSSLITYYSSLGEFSIRRPVSVSRFAYFNDNLHEQRLDRASEGIEEEEKEYEQLGSYFVYHKYRNIHRFFESYKYHRCEKKYSAMVQIDISKCFDSIYTHSIAWAVLGKAQTKFHLGESRGTFAGQFDRLVQSLNHQETNGIVIGPEFSRIFAEIILQAVDVDLREKLFRDASLQHKIDYEIFRYVDDFFVFYNEQSSKLKIIETLQIILKNYKLSINSAKIKNYEKPIITEITIAKERISTLLNEEIEPRCEVAENEGQNDIIHLMCPINSNRLIIRYKTIIKDSVVQYSDLLNYTFSILENKVEHLLKCYLEANKTTRDDKRLLSALLAIIEFGFFCYSASPKVNHTIRLCRMTSTAIQFLNQNRFAAEFKHQIFKYLHDNVIQQIDKNVIDRDREVENLYLLVSLSQIGKAYWLPESTLVKYFSIKEREGNYERAQFLNHFSLTVLLAYMKEKKRYNRLRNFIEEHILDKLKFTKAHCPSDAESLFLLFDLTVCPYISPATKSAIGQIFGLDAAALARFQASNQQWFTAWGDKFDLGKELDAKRSREVY
jgi:hypothetical protein